MRGSSAAHTALVNAILAELGALPGVVIGANASGRAAYTGEDGRRWRIPYGWLSPGGADVIAAVAPHGVMVCLEAKTGNARPTAAQRRVHAALSAVGVVVAVVHDVDEARAAIESARRA